MNWVVLPPHHEGPKYLDLALAIVQFPPNLPPIPLTMHGPKDRNAAEGQFVPQISRQARSLSDADKWVAAEHEEVRFLADNKKIGRTSPLLPEDVIANTTIFVYALKYALKILIERCKTR